jgi:hypothetical protein
MRHHRLLEVAMVVSLWTVSQGYAADPAPGKSLEEVVRLLRSVESRLERIEARLDKLERPSNRTVDKGSDPVKALGRLGGKVAIRYRKEGAYSMVSYLGGDEGLVYLNQLPRLESLDASDSAITDAGLRDIAEHRSLHTLKLSGTSVTDNGIAHLAGLPELRELSLRSTGLTSHGMKHLAELRKLENLDLSYTSVTDESLKHLQKLTELRSLWLIQPGQMQGEKWSSTFHGEGLKYLSGAQQLKTLGLSNTTITDASLKHLPPLKSLEDLRLGVQDFGDEGLEHLKALRQLRYLEGGVNTKQEKELSTALPELDIYNP